MIPATHRIDVYMHPDLKLLVRAQAERENRTLNDIVSDILCAHYGLDAVAFRPPRQSPGRKVGWSEETAKRSKRKTPAR